MQTIDAAGNVVFWADLDSNNQADRLVLGLTDGNLLIAARHGDPTPMRQVGSMDAWPAINGNIGTLNVATPGPQNGALSAHMAFNHCPSGTPTPSPTATTESPPSPTATPTATLPSPTTTPTSHRGRLQSPDTSRHQDRVLLRRVKPQADGQILAPSPATFMKIMNLRIPLLLLSLAGVFGAWLALQTGYARTSATTSVSNHVGNRGQLIRAHIGSGKILFLRPTLSTACPSPTPTRGLPPVTTEPSSGQPMVVTAGLFNPVEPQTRCTGFRSPT